MNCIQRIITPLTEDNNTIITTMPECKMSYCKSVTSSILDKIAILVNKNGQTMSRLHRNAKLFKSSRSSRPATVSFLLFIQWQSLLELHHASDCHTSVCQKNP